MKNKIAGTLYGMAIGDAMGMPSELWSRKKVQQFFRGITDFLDGPSENEVAYQYKRGQFTDDTAQALIILDSLIANHFNVLPTDIATRLLAWAKKEQAFEKNILGPTSKAALLSFKEGKNIESITNQSGTNGSAMRIPPVGCLFLPDEKSELIQYVAHITKVTHSSDITIAGACMIAHAVSCAMIYKDFDEILQSVYSIEQEARALGADTINPSLVARTKLGIEFAKRYKDQDESFLEAIYQIIGCGVTISESVPAALAIAYYAKDVKHCSLLCANLGGDTDTIGAMACAICGAYQGYTALDSSWVELINEANDVNLMEYVDALAEQRGGVM